MAYSVCHATFELKVRLHHRYVSRATTESQTGVLSTLAECYLSMSLWHQYDVM